MKIFAFAALALAGCTIAILPAQAIDPLATLIGAEFSSQAGDMKSAAAAYAEAAAAMEDSAIAERAARIALVAGDDAAASRALARWRELAPKNNLDRLQLEAILALRTNHRTDAVAAFEPLLAASGTEGWQRALQSFLASSQSLITGLVLSDLLDAGHIPDQPDAWFSLAGVAVRLGQTVLAERLADGAIRRFPQSARIWIWQSQRQRAAGDKTAALAATERARHLTGTDKTLRLAVAAEFDALGDLQTAAATLAEGEQDETLLSGRISYLARAKDKRALAALYKELRKQQAKADTQSNKTVKATAPASSPETEIDYPYLLAQSAELLERYQEALDWYQKATAPTHLEAAELRIAVVLDKLNRLDEAITRLRTLQASDSDNGELLRDAYLLEAELLLGHSRRADAIAAYNRGLQIFEDDGELLYARALAFEGGDRLEEAEKDLRRLVELNPDDPNALNALGYTLADRTGKLDEAQHYIEQALKLAPDSAAIIDSLGWLLYRQGRSQEALEKLRLAFQKLPDAEVAAHLGEVLWESGQRDEARQILEQGRKLDADNKALRRVLERYGL